MEFSGETAYSYILLLHCSIDRRHAIPGSSESIATILLVELALIFSGWAISPEAIETAAAPITDASGLTNTEALGRLLYTRYIYFFQMAGLVLLVAMVGAIVLTLRHKQSVKRQDISAQVARTPQTAIEVKKVKPGQGI